VQLDKGCINDVLLVPDISANLLSIYQICHSGNGKTIEFSPNDVIIRELQNPDIVVASGKVDHSSRLYKFASFESSLGSSFIAHVDALSKLWHERFGHLNYRYLQQLSTQKLVLGLPKVSCTDGVCPGCVLGKHIKILFLKEKHGVLQHLLSWYIVISCHFQLAHFQGLSMHSPSLMTSHVALGCTFLSTRVRSLLLLRTSRLLLRSSHLFLSRNYAQIMGGSMSIRDSQIFVENMAFNIKLIVPYNPQQNGVAERKNRTLKEMENCMIQSKNMAPSFWAEAVNCANYIQNRMPHRAVLHKTPEEAWSHVKPDVSTFRVFGSPAWALIPVEKRKAMEKKSQPLIFVGYCEDIKAYRLFEPITKEVFFRRAVRFDEGFNPTSNPSPSSDCHVDNGVLNLL
jgi:hypothetical protein